MTSSADRADIDPDDKDWTWVMQRACPDCGFDATAVGGRHTPSA